MEKLDRILREGGKRREEKKKNLYVRTERI